MTRIRCAIAAAVVVILVPLYLGAQTAVRTLPITGTVVDRSGVPTVGVHVLLTRHSDRQGHAGEAVEILSQGDTDVRGQFALGNVPLKAELEFPLETSVRLEYAVTQTGATLPIDSIIFTAPRTSTSVDRVAAEIRLR